MKIIHMFLGYVSEASEKDILNNETIKIKHVPGLKVGKTGLEKTFEKEVNWHQWYSKI